MRDYRFAIVPDRYFRGNGRWAKVVRLHDKLGDPVNGVQRWRPKYSVAFGNEGNIVAHRCCTYGVRQIADGLAKDWVAE